MLGLLARSVQRAIQIAFEVLDGLGVLTNCWHVRLLCTELKFSLPNVALIGHFLRIPWLKYTE